MNATTEKTSPYATITEVAKLTGYSTRGVLKLVHAGVIPAFRLRESGKFLIPTSYLAGLSLSGLAALAKEQPK
jgi:excisionase family DNA binding protein